MTEAIEAFNLKLLLFIRESMLDDQSSKLKILLGLDKETAQLISSISIDEVITLSKSGFLLFSPRIKCDEFRKILASKEPDPKTLIEILNRNG
ncbi:flagellar transcriptional regulator FlhD [Methylomonas sp. SURF-1]|uniref:Flagellar transcriptional regulator FlhD n=1 Tax=Methylomonas aurea TaxID=2952224 RepID=A0ABT1UN19_9GAMM|nr:flagellar transcriptional regulator FlhD [Methylomonas sp. SURF-1]MCQ8183507.1 flagellar transcriptional regulator FlhD [Methylomonas sp. SURF-1]